MAILTGVAADRHLYCIGTNFTASNTPYSITVWINAVWSSGNTYSFVGMYDGTPPATGTPTTGLQIGTRGAGGILSCWTYGGNLLVQSGAVMTPYDNVWCMITYTYDGVNHNLYRNDTLLATTTTAVVTGTFTQVYINGYPPTGTANETTSFSIDSYTYYGRTLSAAEIQTIYNAAGARHGITNGMLARYEFDELAQGATVSTVLDMSGNGNTLNNTGAGAAITYTYPGTYANSNLRPVQ